MQLAPSTAGSPEHELQAYLAEIRHRLLGRRALWIRLAHMNEATSRVYCAELALKLVSPVVHTRPGRVFRLATDDIILIAQGVTDVEIEGLAGKAAYIIGASHTGHDGTIATFDLMREFDEFGRRVQIEVDRADGMTPATANTPAARTLAPSGRVLISSATKPVSSAPTIRQARRIAVDTPAGRVDVAEICEMSTVALLYGDTQPKERLHRIAVKPEAVRLQFAQGADLGTSADLKARAFVLAEKAMLGALSRGAYDDNLTDAWVALSLRSLLAPEFLAFDRARVAGREQRPILAVPYSDWIAGDETSRYARTFTSDWGYRFALTGISASAIDTNLNMDRVAAIEIDVEAKDLELGEAARAAIVSAIRKFGRDRIVFAGIDDKRLLAFGTSLGATLFRGRLIDQLLAGAKL